MALDTKDNDYLQQSELWQQVRAAIKGKYAIIDIVNTLPGPQYKSYSNLGGMSAEALRHANSANFQNSRRVNAYWARGRFFNATARTADSLDGMIWANDPIVELPKSIDYMTTNADGVGGGIREVAQLISDDLVSVGRYGVLVDMPVSNGRLTQAQQENQQFAPKLITYKPEQIIYTRQENGLEEVRLLETKEVKKNDFDYEKKQFIRRLVIIDGVYVNQLFNDKKELIEEHTPVINGQHSKEILFQFFGADNNTASFSKIPLLDLASMNLGHFVLDCDNRDNLHFHGQGMTNVFTEMSADEFDDANPNGLDTGAKGVNLFQTGDKVELLQLSATGAIAEEMARDEKRMIYLGAQLVQDSTSSQTLGAKQMEVNASMSTLKRISKNISAGLEQCLKWAAAFLGDSKADPKYSLNTEFVTDKMDAQTLALHFQTVQSGLMPKSEYWDVARKAGLTTKTNEDLEQETQEDDLMVVGESEEMASLRAENDALKAQLNENNNNA